MTRADASADAIYDALRADFGEFSAKASGYLSERSFLRERAMILDVIGDERGAVLDIAGGAGLVTLPLAKAGRRVVGVDFNAAACEQAGRNGIAAVCGDAFALPLADGMADVVVNVEFAQQYDLRAVERMLHEAARVLRPTGRLVIAWSNRAALVHRSVSAALSILAEACGWSGMVGGQAYDLASVGQAQDLDGLQAMHGAKTGALFNAAMRLGALFAGAKEADMALAAGYGDRIGLAFQIIDDVLDATANSAALGKPAGADARAGKPTFASLLGVDEARRRAANAPAEGRPAHRWTPCGMSRNTASAPL